VRAEFFLTTFFWTTFLAIALKSTSSDS
jgi:hypothetical protein